MSDPRLEFLQPCARGAGASLGDGGFSPGPAIWVGKREVAHFDGPDELDVRVTKAVIRARRAEFRADGRIERRRRTSDWIRMRVASESDREHALTPVRAAIEANRELCARGREAAE